MKNLKIFLLLSFICTSCIIAKDSYLGLIGGSSFSGYYDDGNEYRSSRNVRELSPRIGYEFGLFAKFEIKKWLYFTSSLKFMTKGGSTLTYLNRDLNDFTLKSNYLSVPILLVFKPYDWFNIEIGPEVGYLISYSSQLLNPDRLNFGKLPSGDFYVNSKIEISGLIGLSFDLNKNINVGVHYSHAINNNIVYIIRDNNGLELFQSSIYNRTISVFLRYKLFKF